MVCEAPALRARAPWRLLVLGLLLLVGCTSYPQAPPAVPGPGRGPVESGAGAILFRSILERSVPASVDRLRFVAYDAEGHVVYGPVTRERAAEILLSDVTTQVAALLTVYLKGDLVLGLDANTIVLPPGETVVVEGTFRALETVATLAVEPRDQAVPLGTELRYTAMATVLGSRSFDVTELVDWDSSNAAVATVSDDPAGQASAVAPGGCVVSARYGALADGTPLTVTGASLVSLAVEPPNATLAVGDQQSYRAIGSFDDGGTRDMTAEVAWSVDDAAVASLTSAGDLTALAPGATTVRARDPGTGVQGAAAVTVEPPPVTLVRLQITPLRVRVPAGRAVELAATGIYSDGSTRDLTRIARWTSTDTSVAAVSGFGLVRGLAPRRTTVEATFRGVEGTREVTVTWPVLARVEVHPRAVEIPAGIVHAFQATGVYTDGSVQDLTAQASWSSGAPGVAWVADAPGSKGTVTAEAPGAAAIRATDPVTGLAGTGTAVVTPAVLTRLEVAPDPARVLEGRSVAFRATGIYSDDTTQDLTTRVSWSTGDPAVALVGNSPGEQGTCLGVAPGQTAVRAVEPESGLQAEAALSVLARPEVRLEISPVSATLPAGTTASFQATLLVGGNLRFDVTEAAAWETTDPAVAEAAPGGTVLGMAPGTCRLRARLADSDLVASAGLQVTPAVLTGLAVDPPLAVVQEGGSVRFRAVGRFSDDSVRDVTDQAAWSVQDPAVMAVSNAEGSRGQGTALAPGATVVTARVEGVGAEAQVSVTPAPLLEIVVAPDAPTLGEGVHQSFAALGVTAVEVLDLTQDVLWETSDPSVLTVSNAEGSQGLGTAVGAGTATVTARDPASGLSGSTVVTVTPATLVSLRVVPEAQALAAGGSARLRSLATWSDGSETDVTTGSAWTSLDPAIATVSNAVGEEGTVTGRSAGDVRVEATLEGQAATAGCAVTVLPPVATGIELLAATHDLLPEDVLPVIAIGHSSDGTQVDLTPQVIWETSDPDILGVIQEGTCRGVACALAPGSATVSAHLPGTSAAGTWSVVVGSDKGKHGSLAILPRVVNGRAGDPTVPLTAYAVAHPLDGCSAEDVTTRSRWTSLDLGVFTVDGKGVVTFVGPGQSEVVAEWSSARIPGIARIVGLEGP